MKFGQIGWIIKRPGIKIFLSSLLSFFLQVSVFSQIILSGQLSDPSGEGIEYGSVEVVSDKRYAINTDSTGRFSQLIRKSGKVAITASHVNYMRWDSTLCITHDTVLVIVLEPRVEHINEVVVTAEGEKTDNNLILLDQQDIVLKSKSLGEADIIGLLQRKTGVIHTSELSTGIFVRGMQQGNTGLVFSGTELFGTSHVLGIYPQFNSDAINKVQLLKADFDPGYGGYLASYLLVEPDHELVDKWSGRGEIGFLTTKLNVRFPVIREKISANISLRRSYFDLIARTYNGINDDISDASKFPMYGFLDINTSIIWKTRKQGIFTVDLYSTSDEMDFNNPEVSFTSKWKSHLITAGWNRSLSPKADMNLIAGYAGFDLETRFSQPLSREIQNAISQGNVSATLTYWFSEKLKGQSGAELKMNRMELDALSSGYGTQETASLTNELSSGNVALFEGLQYYATPKLSFKAGIRLETFYSDSLFVNLMPCFSSDYQVGGYDINLSYSRQVQYKHLFVPTGINLPMNIWYPSQSDVPPGKANHYNLTVTKDLFSRIKVSVSVYYIHLTDLTEFLEGNYITSLDFTTDVGHGYSHGVETGFVWKGRSFEIEGGFTLSKSKRKFSAINEGAWFSPSFDIRYKADISILYRLGERWTFSLSQFYQDGYVMTMPTSIYLHQTADREDGMDFNIVPVYTARYNYRMPASHRMDISASYDLKWTKTKAGLSMGIYNVYNYRNPYYVYYSTEYLDDQTVYLKTKTKSLLPLVPFISFNMSF